MDKRLNIPMPAELLEALTEQAEAEKRKPTPMARILIEEALENRARQSKPARRPRRKSAAA